ncbi:MAG: tetratricopeptide repeat protein [Planctomycetota bacterium]|jgi:hypothetical protein
MQKRSNKSFLTGLRGITVVVFAFLLLLSPHPALADVIHLVNGGRLEGRIISENEKEIVFEKGSIRTTILRTQISYIERTSESSESKPEAGAEDREKRAKELYDKGRYREAAAQYRRILANNPLSEETDRMLKLCEALAVAKESMKDKLLKKAKESAGKALELEPENETAKDILKEIERIDGILEEKGSLPGDFLEIRTRHFIIYHNQPYIGEQAAEDAERHLEFLIEALRYEGCPKPKLKEKLKVRIYRNHREYVDAVGKIGAMFPALTTSKTEIAAYQKSIIGGLKHEITHCLVHIILPSMPVWIHEGLATGGYRRAKALGYRLIKNYLDKDRFLPFDDFLKIRTMDEMQMTADAFYAQSRMAVEFLVFAKGGMKKFHKFAARVREGMQKDANAYARSQGKSVSVRNVDFLEKPVRKMLKEMYGYGNLAKLDTDMNEYVARRLKEAEYQEAQQSREFTADWKYSLRLDSEHFALFTTCPKSVAQAQLDIAEETYETVRKEFGDTGIMIPGKLKIYLFAKKKEYADFLKKKGSKISQGSTLVPHFSPFAGAACVFKEGNSREYLFQTTVHEVVHGLSMSLMRSFYGSGCWTVEGITHYVALSANYKKKKIILGEIHQTKKSQMSGYIKVMLKEGKVTPLRAFLNLKQMGLGKITSHVQAWSLFHFLHESDGGKYREGFHKYLAEVCKGTGTVEAFEKHVGKISDIEPKYREYIAKLKPTSNLKMR